MKELIDLAFRMINRLLDDISIGLLLLLVVLVVRHIFF